MKRLPLKITGFLLIASSLLFQISATASEDIYRYHGLKPATGKQSIDGIYQDFAQESATVGKLWADPDARSHDGNELSWVKSHVNRYGKKPFLTVEFARHGYGTSLSIVPKNLVPETIPKNAQLVFEARSTQPVCFGLRFMDRDGEVWGYGSAPLNYQRLCIKPRQKWTRFRVPLKPNHPDWFKFKYSGNVDLGNNEMEANLIAGLQFELGIVGEDYFSPGTASFDLRNIQVKKVRNNPRLSHGLKK